MFRSPTVLVLGAGASCHYGYPTGDELINRIIDTIDNKEFPVIHPSGKNKFILNQQPKYKRLKDNLEFYDPLSIDSFLSQFSNDKEMLDAGKAMIVYEILESENQELLQRFRPFKESSPNSVTHNAPRVLRNENWYRYLVHAITADSSLKELLEENFNLHIITFNYDVSLEYSLYSRFYKSPVLQNDSHNFLKKISDNIVHIYGQVGKFPWKGGNDRTNEDYGDYKGNKAMDRAEQEWKDSIFVIGQDRGNDKIKENAETAIKWLEKAERVFFLGFGFNDDNIELLKLSKSTEKARRIYCTNCNNSQLIRQKIDSLFIRGNGTNSPPNRAPIISDKTVYAALAEDFSLTS